MFARPRGYDRENDDCGEDGNSDECLKEFREKTEAHNDAAARHPHRRAGWTGPYRFHGADQCNYDQQREKFVRVVTAGDNDIDRGEEHDQRADSSGTKTCPPPQRSVDQYDTQCEHHNLKTEHRPRGHAKLTYRNAGATRPSGGLSIATIPPRSNAAKKRSRKLSAPLMLADV